MKRAIQYFSKEQLENSAKLTPKQIIEFLDDFRMLHTQNSPVKSKLISIKVPEDLLRAFKRKSEFEDVPYQTMIKKLMKQWL
jgi:predicted DNA binding CopG/RHH family protein